MELSGATSYWLTQSVAVARRPQADLRDHADRCVLGMAVRGPGVERRETTWRA
jgi:hypothetical protein